MLQLRREEHVHVLTLQGGENRFRLDVLHRWNAVLDQVEAEVGAGPGALVVTGEGKFWSNGIDLEWLGTARPDEVRRFVPTLNALLGRVVSFPVPTVAALNGHTFAGGAMLALAMDYRVMRTGRGWFCLPEVDIQVPIHRAMLRLLERKMTPAALRDAVLLGRRFTAEEALAAGIVDQVCDVEALLPKGLAMAEPLVTKERAIFSRLKTDLYGDLQQSLEADLEQLQGC